MPQIESEGPATHVATQSYKGVFTAAFAGSLGTAAAALLLSSGTFEQVSKLFRSEQLPRNAVIFVSSENCEGVGADWVEMKHIGGNFIIAANADHIAGRFEKGVTSIRLIPENIPQLRTLIQYVDGRIKADSYESGAKFILSLTGDTSSGGTKQDLPISLGGSGQPIDVAPPSYALTACQRR